MKCSSIQPYLDDYLDGEISNENRQLVDRHLTDCTDCRKELDALRSLVEQAGQLRTELRPPHDLWPTIHAQLQTRRPETRLWWSQLAAAGIALVLLSIPLSVWWAGRQESDRDTSTELGHVRESITIQAAMARSEDGVLLARTDLVTAIERQRDVLEEGTLNVFEENMELLDRAIGEIRSALDEDPQNLRLRMLLAARYQQERKLLQKVNRA